LPLPLPVPVPLLSREFRTMADTMVSQPVGGHSPAAERKLGKVPHEEKTSIVGREEEKKMGGSWSLKSIKKFCPP
jgi:hypothetical protein